MRRDELQPNAITYHAIINACGKSSFPEMALQLFVERQQEELWPYGISYSNLFSACGEGSVPERALQLSYEMRQQTYSQMRSLTAL